MTEDEIRDINNKLDKISEELSSIKTCLKGYEGIEGLIARVGHHGNAIKVLTIAVIILACAVLGIDATRGLL